MIEKFYTEDGRCLVTVSKDIDVYTALTLANKYLKAKVKDLKQRTGYVIGDDLYFENVEGSEEVWVIQR